jgi:hypothetical protein
VVGPDGKPVSGVKVVGLAGTDTLKSADFTVRGLHPKRGRRLLFYHKEKGLGCALELRGDETGPLTVRLQPCGSAVGRVVDKAGKPVAGRGLGFCQEGYDRFLGGYVEVKTGRDGRFRADGLVPGQKYRLLREQTSDAELAQLTVEPGKTKDLGDLTVDPDSP